MLIIVASIILLFGLVLVTFGIIGFESLGWLTAIFVILSGATSAGLATMSLITGKPEWILLDLILPG